MSPTTHTSKAGNLWVFELGASADCWVRQADRGRPPMPISATDTGSLEIYDAQYPISRSFRLGAALGLKGDLVLEWVGMGCWELREDGTIVHLFMPPGFESDDRRAKRMPGLPMLNGLDSAGAALDAILAVVEAKPGIGEGQRAADANPAAGALDRIECLVRRQLAHMESLDHEFVRCDDAAALRDLTASWANLLSVERRS